MGKGAGGAGFTETLEKGGALQRAAAGGPPQGPSTPLPRLPTPLGDPLSGLAFHRLFQEAPGPAAVRGLCSLRRWPESGRGAVCGPTPGPPFGSHRLCPRGRVALSGSSSLALCPPQPLGRAPRAWCPPRARSAPAGWSLAAPSPVSTEQQLGLEGSGPHGGGHRRREPPLLCSPGWARPAHRAPSLSGSRGRALPWRPHVGKQPRPCRAVPARPRPRTRWARGAGGHFSRSVKGPSFRVTGVPRPLTGLAVGRTVVPASSASIFVCVPKFTCRCPNRSIPRRARVWSHGVYRGGRRVCPGPA